MRDKFINIIPDIKGVGLQPSRRQQSQLRMEPRGPPMTGIALVKLSSKEVKCCMYNYFIFLRSVGPQAVLPYEENGAQRASCWMGEGLTDHVPH